MGAAGAKDSDSVPRRAQLLQRAQDLCEAFAQRKSLEEVLSHFSEDVLLFEHGLPDLAPFLGREFRGLQGARDYFELIGELLDFEDMNFSDYMVDVDTDQASVRGQAKFIWRSTGKSWQEVFVYRLRFDCEGKISAYEVWADSGAAYVSSMARKRVVLVSYEFTYSPFSGNGILARSIVKALLRLGCRVTVWCCKPEVTSQDHHLAVPEIPLEDQQRLQLIPVQLSAQQGWRQLDEQSAWQKFSLQNLEQRQQLLQEVSSADVLCASDWTGAKALKSLPECLRDKRFVYMNFRVYSSGVAQADRRLWFDTAEREGFEGAAAVVALSQPDREKLRELGAEEVEVLLPPLRGDLQRLALGSAADAALPEEVPRRDGRWLLTCVVRLSQEKQALRFVRLIQRLQSSGVLKELGLVPLLAGATGDEAYAAQVKRELLEVNNEAIVISSFLTPKALCAIFAHTALNVHPCAYDAYGMTVVEAAACGAPSLLATGAGAHALLQEATVTVEMPQEEQQVPEEMVKSLEAALRDDVRLEQLGREAQRKALEWDELAYGRRLLGILCP